MQKMNVIAKISCYFERSVVTLKLPKEYLNTVTYNTPVLLRITYWTDGYERCSMSTYIWDTNFQKVQFLAHPVSCSQTSGTHARRAAARTEGRTYCLKT